MLKPRGESANLWVQNVVCYQLGELMLAPAMRPDDLAARLHRPRLARLPIHYGWVMVVLAAVAMTATLPGRTHGLGLIATPLIQDSRLNVNEMTFAALNFWAIIIGSALCLPAGWLIDRFGVRIVLAGVAAALGACVIWMSQATGIVVLFIALMLVRGLGQGALSIVSMAMVGKWFTRRLPIAMAVFSVLLAIGFIASFEIFGKIVNQHGWRDAWAGLGLVLLLGLAPLGLLLARSTPESIGFAPDREEKAPERLAAPASTLFEALRSPSFWAFTLAACSFNVVWSALTLLSQNLLATRGLDQEVYIEVMKMMVLFGLPANFLGGYLATRWGMGRILALGMAMLAGSLLMFPQLSSKNDAMIYGALLGVSGGIVTVVFFAFYGYAFGRTHLGAIQAAAQVFSVFASALGPLLLAFCKDQTGSYVGFFYVAAPATLILGLSVLMVRARTSEPSGVSRRVSH